MGDLPRQDCLASGLFDRQDRLPDVTLLLDGLVDLPSYISPEFRAEFSKFLHEEISVQASTPIKHLVRPDREILMFWETWALTIVHKRWCYIGIHSWLPPETGNLRPYDLNENREAAHLVQKISNNFSSVATFRAWLNSTIKTWLSSKIATDSLIHIDDNRFANKLSAELAKTFDERYAMSAILASYLDCKGDKRDICSLAAVAPMNHDRARLLVSATKLPFVCEPIEQRVSLLYARLIQCLDHSGIASKFSNGRALLKMFNLTQSTRDRLLRLDLGEVAYVCVALPTKFDTASAFLNELSRTLQQIHYLHQRNPEAPRHRFSWGATNLTSLLTKLRAASGRISHISEKCFRALTKSLDRSSFSNFTIVGHTDELEGAIPINSAIVFFELYLDELLGEVTQSEAFPRHSREALIDDAASSYCQTINCDQIPADVLEYSSDGTLLPDITSTTDWFVSVLPQITKQHVMLGWKGLEKRAHDWHRNFRWVDDDIEYREWRCHINDRYKDWTAQLPSDLAIELIPLVNSEELLGESTNMSHCVVTYIDACASNSSRIFSIREKSSGKALATAELHKNAYRWELNQLKGPHNIEMIGHMHQPQSPINILISKAIDWYNTPSAKEPWRSGGRE